MDLTNYIEIENFPNYKISREGLIYSCRIKRTMTMQITNGYHYVFLIKDGKRYINYLHRLLGKAFIQNTDNKPEIDHIDRDKNNNSIDNLRWVTRTENNRNKGNYKDNLTAEQLEARRAKNKENQKERMKNYMRKYRLKLKTKNI
jgi:hypothetical protein